MPRVQEDFISRDAVPFIKISLGNVAGAIQDINNQVTPYVIGIVKPLAEDELANVPVLLARTKGLLGGLKDYATALLSGLSKGKSSCPFSSFSRQLCGIFGLRGTHRRIG